MNHDDPDKIAMTTLCDTFQITNNLLASASVDGVPEDKKAIASEWQVISQETGIIKIFHVTIRIEPKSFGKVEYQISIDDTSKFIGVNSRIIPVRSGDSKDPISNIYYTINANNFVLFDIFSILPKLEPETTSKKPSKKLSLKRKNTQNNGLSAKKIHAIKNLDIKDQKLKNLFEAALRIALENYLNEEAKKEKAVTDNFLETSALLESKSHRRRFFCCFC